MSAKNFKTIAVTAMFLCTLIGQSFAAKKSADYEDQKLILVQNLFSCQSIVKNTIDVNDGAKQLKYLYISLGSEYFESAEKSFEKMKSIDAEMDKKLIKNVSNLLKMHDDFFKKANDLTKVEMTSSLVLDMLILQKVMKQLYAAPK